MSVAGLVLAAGRSSRMGLPKARLRFAGTTFLGAILERLRQAGATPVIVVGRGDAGPEETAAQAARAVTLINPDPDRGMLSSVQLGIVELDARGAEAVLVWPVDHPAVRPDTVRALIEAFAGSHAPVVVPCHAGRGGHPTLFARSTFAAIAAAPEGSGARAVVEALGPAVLRLEVDDPGVLIDVDTPSDLARLVQDARLGSLP